MKLDDIQPNHHWFRRIIHISGASVLVYYLCPDSVSWVYSLKIVIMFTILISAIIVESLRLSNRLDEGFLFAFRSYEANRVGAHIWFGISMIILLLLFPQQIAAPCILVLCFADPLIGEIRNKNRVLYHVLSIIIGVAVCLSIFYIFNYQIHVAFLATLLAVGAEGIKTKKIDDNLLMPMAPAIVIYILTLLGIISLPEILITPFLM